MKLIIVSTYYLLQQKFLTLLLNTANVISFSSDIQNQEGGGTYIINSVNDGEDASPHVVVIVQDI